MIQPQIDHLVYAVPDLAAAIDAFEADWGVRPAEGGQHPSGTHNALLSLGGERYLEIIAPDPTRPDMTELSFGLDDPPAEGKLVAWAAAVNDIDEAVRISRENGFDPGSIGNGGRQKPNGESLSWRSTQWGGAGWPPPGDGLIPFLIEWGPETMHPSVDAPHGARLAILRGFHPHIQRIELLLRALGIVIDLELGEEPKLSAVFDTPKGQRLLE